jgi:hypothetical protein
MFDLVKLDFMNQNKLPQSALVYPMDVAPFGAPERCSNCPYLNIQHQYLSSLRTDPGSSAWARTERARRNEEDKQTLAAMAESCPGQIHLTTELIESVLQEAGVESPIVTADGYQCPQVGRKSYAAVLENGQNIVVTEPATSSVG